MRSWKSLELQHNGIKRAFRPRREEPKSYELLPVQNYDPTVSQHIPPPGELPPRPISHHPWRNLLTFAAQNTSLLSALAAGLAGAFGCFAFAYWLSTQLFECPDWAIECSVQSSAKYFRDRLGFVQGILSSVYGVCIAMIVYATYQFAETTLWPALVENAFKLRDVDRYLSHARGSLPMFPLALWGARMPFQIGVIVTVGLASILLQLSSTVVGWTFTIVPVSTVLHSKYATGGGMGFGFAQRNPPAPMPLEPSNAYVMYNSWASQQSNEMLPHLRDFIIDRTRLSLIGDFSAAAVEARKTIHCYGEPIEIKSSSMIYDQNPGFTVATHFSTHQGGIPNADRALLRVQAGILTAWVDSYYTPTDTSGVTKLMFAVLDSTIEGGHQMALPQTIKDYCTGYGEHPCEGVSSLACDVHIELIDSHACSGKCDKVSTSEPLSKVNELVNAYQLPIWLGVQPSLMGQAILGAQPMWVNGEFELPHSNYSLPISYSDFDVYNVYKRMPHHWTQENLTNFINVSSGALATYIAQEWNGERITIESRLKMARIATSRTYAMLGPPGIALLTVVLVVIFTGLMHDRTRVPDVKLGWMSEILHAQDLQGLLDEIRSGKRPKADLEEIQLRYGFSKDGLEVIGPEEQVSVFSGS